MTSEDAMELASELVYSFPHSDQQTVAAYARQLRDLDAGLVRTAINRLIREKGSVHRPPISRVLDEVRLVRFESTPRVPLAPVFTRPLKGRVMPEPGPLRPAMIEAVRSLFRAAIARGDLCCGECGVVILDIAEVGEFLDWCFSRPPPDSDRGSVFCDGCAPQAICGLAS